MIPTSLAAAVGGSAGRRPFLVCEAAAPGYVDVDGHILLNMASCDYLGLARHSEIVRAASEALCEWGVGSAAVRNLSGTTGLHGPLERELAAWVGCEDSVLHSSCWAANAALFGALSALATAGQQQLAVFSDRLNHASIIDALRAQRSSLLSVYIYDHTNLSSLAQQLRVCDSSALRVVVTDGVFSMEGDTAPIADLVALAAASEALLVVDDSHGVGVAGATGRGTAEACGVLSQVDVITGTLGKALGGAGGGFIASTVAISAWLRACSRPYAFSNNPPPTAIAAALACIRLLRRDRALLATLRDRTQQLREGVLTLGLPSVAGSHPIVPIVLGDESRTAHAAQTLRDRGVFAVPLSYPIVGRGTARLRLQVSALHSQQAIEAVIRSLKAI